MEDPYEGHIPGEKPSFDALRSNAQFQDLQRRMGLAIARATN
jgi:hypothetical protein